MTSFLEKWRQRQVQPPPPSQGEGEQPLFAEFADSQNSHQGSKTANNANNANKCPLPRESRPAVSDETLGTTENQEPNFSRQLITPPMLKTYRLARSWLLPRWTELEAAGWTRRELFRAGDGLRFPFGPWGVAWLPHWSGLRVTPSLEPGGVLVFTIHEVDGRVVRQRALPVRNRP